MHLVPLCMSLCSCWSFCKLCADGLSEPVISSLTALPSWLGDDVTQMLPTDTLPLTIPFPCYEASACIRSSVVGQDSLCCFCFLLPTHTMLPLHNACWHGPCTSIRSILGSSVWTQPIGACVSLPGFTACLVQSPSLHGIPRTRRTAPACPQPGPEKNLANEVPSSASFVAFSSFFTSTPPLFAAGQTF